MARRKRTVSIKDLTRRISKNLASLGGDFLNLGRAIHSGMSARAGKGGGPGRPPGRGRGRAKRVLTPADRARLRVQGEYLGLVRHLSVAARARVKSLRAKKGYPAAIKLARRLVKSRG